MRKLLAFLLLLSGRCLACANGTVTYNSVVLKIVCAVSTDATNPSGQATNRTVDLVYPNSFTGSTAAPTVVIWPGVGWMNANAAGLDTCNVSNQAYNIASGQAPATTDGGTGVPSVVICPYPTTQATLFKLNASVASGSSTSAVVRQVQSGSTPTYFPNYTPADLSLSACTNCTYTGIPEMVFDPNTANQEFMTPSAQGGTGNLTLTPTGTWSQSHTVSTPTATTTSGNSTLTSVTSTTNILKGMDVTGTGIQNGTTVLATTVNTVTLSYPATASGSGVTITFSPLVMVPKFTYPAGPSDAAAELSWATANLGGGTYPGSPSNLRIIGTSSGSHDALLVLSYTDKTKFLNNATNLSWFGSHGIQPASSNSNVAWTVKAFSGISVPLNPVMMCDCQISGNCPTLLANGGGGGANGLTQNCYNVIGTLGANPMTVNGDPSNAANGFGVTANAWATTISPLALAGTLGRSGVSTLVMIGGKDPTTPPDMLAPWQAAYNSKTANTIQVTNGFHGLSGCGYNTTCWDNIANRAVTTSFSSVTNGVVSNGTVVQ